MESLSKKRITVVVHLEGNVRKPVNVYLTDKVKSLEFVNPAMDFYFHGEKLDVDKTFEDSNLQHQAAIHTSDKARSVFEFDPIYFKFLNGIVIELPVPKIWTFKRTVEVLGASNGIEPHRISLIFQGRKMDPKLAFMDLKSMSREATVTVVVTGEISDAS